MKTVNKLTLLSAPILASVVLLPLCCLADDLHGLSVDPLVGSFTFVIDACGGIPGCQTTPGNETFQAGGTLNGHDAGAIGGPGIFGKIALATAHTGSWKKVSKRHYKVLLFNAVNYMGPAADFFNPDASNVGTTPTVPYSPVGWLPVVMDVTLSKDGKTLHATNAQAYFCALTDPSCAHAQPVGPPATAVGYRIFFDTFGNKANK